ncbi:MAG: glycosyltransferase family 4 protein [Lentisphaeria bacterium]|jgi:glycosyltransferase involved in cell wall biosynthesis
MSSKGIALDGSVVRPPYSGVQLSVSHEIQALAECFPAERLCLFSRDEGLAAFATERRIARLAPPFWTSRPAGRATWQQLFLPAILRRCGVAVLHAFAYTAPLRCPVPYVLNVHDLIALEHPELCATTNVWHMRALLPGSARRAAMNIVSTEHVAGRLMSILGIPHERIVVAPLGVDAARFSTPAPRPAELSPLADRPYLLFVSNIEPKKGLDTLLDAYAACADAIGGLPLVIAGRAAWKSAAVVQRIQHWRGPGTIYWLGRASAAILPGLYQHAAALVMPSITEGFGMPVLEAMAAGTPVIHSDHPALCEAAGNAGLSFAVGDAQDLAAKLRRLQQSKSLQEELRAAGRQHAASFTWRRWGESAAAVLKQILQSGKGGA